MIFSCGETNGARAERQQAEYSAWLEKHSQWHPCFALWPRRIAVLNGKKVCAWMEIVERKGEWRNSKCHNIDGYSYDGQVWGWEYRRKA